MTRWLMTVRVITEHRFIVGLDDEQQTATVSVITEHRFIVEADDEQQARALTYGEVHVHNDLGRGRRVEIHAREITP